MTDQLISKVRWNLYSVWGLRGLRKRWWWLLILNRILRRVSHTVVCMCGRQISWLDCWSVCCDDTLICNECMKEGTNGEYDNESEPIRRLWKWHA